MPRPPQDEPSENRRYAGLSDCDLWLRYFELDGMSTPGPSPATGDDNMLTQAMSERLAERDRSPHKDGSLSEPIFQSPVHSGAQIKLLGSFDLSINTKSVRLPMNSQRLVSFLALHNGSLLRQHVAGSLWGETTERRASGSLRSAVWRLGHPTHPLVEIADPHIRLSPSVEVDLHASEALARRILDDSHDLSESDMDDALLSTDLLPDWTEDWVIIKRENHTQLRLRALETLCRKLSVMKRFGPAVQAGMLAVSAEPLRESAQRTLIAAHIAEGNFSAAMRQYTTFRELLRDELQIDPSPQMQTLVEGLHQ